MEFRAEINGALCNLTFKEFLNQDDDYDCEKAIINYEVQFETREWGIKDISIIISSIILIFNVDDEIKEFIIKDNKDSWIINIDLNIGEKFYHLAPYDIWVDFDNKKVEVEF